MRTADQDVAKEVGAVHFYCGLLEEQEQEEAGEEALATGMKFKTGYACKMAQTCATVANGGKQQIKRQFSDNTTGAERGSNKRP